MNIKALVLSEKGGIRVLRGNLHSAKVAITAMHDPEISSKLNNKTIDKFCAQLARGFNKRASRKNYKNILNIENNPIKAADYKQICKDSHEQATRMLKDKSLSKKKLMEMIKTYPSLNKSDKEVFIGLAKSISHVNFIKEVSRTMKSIEKVFADGEKKLIGIIDSKFEKIEKRYQKSIEIMDSITANINSAQKVLEEMISMVKPSAQIK